MATLQSAEIESLNAADLVDHIVGMHHRYIRSNIPVLRTHLEHMAEKHGDEHNGLDKLIALFSSLANKLTAHIEKEEELLFPFIKRLAEAEKNIAPVEDPPFFELERPLNLLQIEHESVDGLLDEIRAVTHAYEPPSCACRGCRECYHKLKELDEDMAMHIHLEREVLFPRALQLEKKLSRDRSY